MKATRSVLVFLGFMMTFVKAHAAGGFSPVTVDTQVICHVSTATKTTLPVAEYQDLGSVSFKFESTKAVHVDSNFGPTEIIFGFGKAEVNQMVRSWDANKNEILTPFHAIIEVGMNAQGPGKTMKSSITMKNPFTNQLETQDVVMNNFFVSDSFVYTQATYRGPKGVVPAIGEFFIVEVLCEFGVAN